jgi:hypothetical protein
MYFTCIGRHLIRLIVVEFVEALLEGVIVLVWTSCSAAVVGMLVVVVAAAVEKCFRCCLALHTW